MNKVTALPDVDRRSLLRSAILLVGGSLAGVPNIALAASADRFFTPAQFAIMSDMADIIIPRTASPGAKDAGVPDVLDQQHWHERYQQGPANKWLRSTGADLFLRELKQRLALTRLTVARLCRFAASVGQLPDASSRCACNQAYVD